VTVLPTIVDAARDLRAGRVSSARLVDDALAAIARHQPQTNAFISVAADDARAAAHAADAERARGTDRGPLHGIPISLKDLIDQQGVVTTAGSRALRDRVAAIDAPLVARLRTAGAVIIGRTNLHEFALGTTSDDSAFGAVHHPADHTRSAGGSSGGSAAAVALGMGFASIGTDTGGSIRIPAAACGVVGLKPAFGEVPTEGVIPLSSSLDHAGPIARSVEDAALLWSALADHPLERLEPIRPARLRRLTGVFDTPLAPEVRDAFNASIARLPPDVVVDEIELEGASSIPSVYVDIVLPEGAAWHGARLDQQRDDYTPRVHSRFLAGREIPAVRYIAAQTARAALRRIVDELLADCDGLILPTLPILAPGLGLDEIAIGAAAPGRTPVRSAMLRQTQPFNLTGHPAISIPLSVSGLPVGLQLVGATTPQLVRIAAWLEQRLGARG
jgi:aspartyl-tRNA(Asn)/glutamyl-tRNA(Gln) amidotransferase subunit A